MNKSKVFRIIAHIAALILIGIVLQIGAAYLLEVITELTKIPDDVQNDYKQVYEALTVMTPGMITYVAVVAPLLEEAIFRLGLIGMGRKFMPYWVINIIQSVLFGIYHGDLIQGAYAFVLGIVLGIIFEFMGGYVASLITHMAINIAGLYIAPILPVMSVEVMIMIGIVCLLIVGALMYLDIRYIYSKKI